MRISLVCVGRMKSGPGTRAVRALFHAHEGDGAVGRASPMSNSARSTNRERGGPKIGARRRPRPFVKALGPRDVLVALDERGASPTQRRLGGRHRAGARRRAQRLCRCHRRSGRLVAFAAGEGAEGDQLRSDDLAAPACSGHGRRAALPRAVDFGGSSLSPRIIAAIRARFDDCGRGMRVNRSRAARSALRAAALGAAVGCAPALVGPGRPVRAGPRAQSPTRRPAQRRSCAASRTRSGRPRTSAAAFRRRSNRFGWTRRG